MLTALFTVFVALAVPGLVLLIVSARRAPVGFEDERGFHVVEESSLPGGAVLSAAARVG